MSARAPIGIFGGTFDPIHFGHLRLAQEAVEQCNLASVRFIPSGTPPHRAAPYASAQHRLNMVRLAIQGNEKFVLDEREIFRTDPCYTVDTLTAMRVDIDLNWGSQQPLCLLLGSDAFLLLHTWYEWEKLFSLAHIVVLHRPQNNAVEQDFSTRIAQASSALHRVYQERASTSPVVLSAAPAGAILRVDIPALEISSSTIRARCADNKDIHYLLPDTVASYIHTHHLYHYADYQEKN